MQLSYTFCIYSSNFEFNVSRKSYLLYIRTVIILLIESDYIKFKIILVLLIVTDINIVMIINLTKWNIIYKSTRTRLDIF
jgi:hypothetical protein